MGQDPTQQVFTGNTSLLGTNQKWQIGTTAATPYADGDKVRITHANSKGFDGTYRINVLANNLIQLAGNLSTSLVPLTLCFMQRFQQANGTRNVQFYQYQPPSQGWANYQPKITGKKVGRQHLAVTFRSKRRSGLSVVPT